MTQTSKNFQSVGAKTLTDKLALSSEDPFAGISFLPRNKYDRMKKEQDLSPKSIKKKVNTFLEQQVLQS